MLNKLRRTSYILLLSASTLLFSNSSNADDASKTFLYDLNLTKSRPSNFYMLHQGKDKKVCKQILGYLNESFQFEKFPANNSIRNLTGNSHSVKWTYGEENSSEPSNDNSFVQKDEKTSYFRHFNGSDSGQGDVLVVIPSNETEPLKKDFMHNVDWHKSINLNQEKRILGKDGDETLVPDSLYKTFPFLGSHMQDIMRVSNIDYILVAGDAPAQFCGKTYPVMAHKLTSDTEATPICHFESIPKIECQR